MRHQERHAAGRDHLGRGTAHAKEAHHDVLVTLVEAWERKHYRLDLPDPVEAIRYHMEQSGLQPRDLIPFISSSNRVHELLNSRRELILNMIRRLHEGLGIPAESLVKIGQHNRRARKQVATVNEA